MPPDLGDAVPPPASTSAADGPGSAPYRDVLGRVANVVVRGIRRGHLYRTAPKLRSVPEHLPVPGPCFGRDDLLDGFVRELESRKPPLARISVVGAGGIGKTRLATALVHHSKVAKIFGARRYWVDLERCTSTTHVPGAVAAVLPVSSMTTLDAVTTYLAQAPCLLILDDLDALADSASKRTSLAKLLDRLGSSCSLVVTLRSATRLPTDLDWTRPPKLEGLEIDAATEVFCILAKTHADDPDLQSLIEACDGLPLALWLLSRQATEGLALSALWQRWQAERSRLLSEGSTKLDSIAISATLSLTHPSIATNEDAWNVLRVTAPVKEGVTFQDLVRILPRTDVARALGLLLDGGLVQLRHSHARSSSAGTFGRYLLLAPIRTFVMDTTHCPSAWSVMDALSLFQLPDFRYFKPAPEFELLNGFRMPKDFMMCYQTRSPTLPNLHRTFLGDGKRSLASVIMTESRLTVHPDRLGDLHVIVPLWAAFRSYFGAARPSAFDARPLRIGSGIPLDATLPLNLDMDASDDEGGIHWNTFILAPENFSAADATGLKPGLKPFVVLYDQAAAIIPLKAVDGQRMVAAAS